MAPQDGVHMQSASFWRARKSEVMSLGKREQSLWLFCRQTSVTVILM